MKFLLITGDHPRHMFIADVLCKNNFSFDWIIEKRERHIPKINKKYKSKDFENFAKIEVNITAQKNAEQTNVKKKNT